MDLWKKYIAFEKSNPLRSEDTSLVTRRVMFATEQCLLVLTHHPAVWHQAAQYLDQSSKLLTEKGVRIIYSICIRCYRILNSPYNQRMDVLSTVIYKFFFSTGHLLTKINQTVLLLNKESTQFQFYFISLWMSSIRAMDRLVLLLPKLPKFIDEIQPIRKWMKKMNFSIHFCLTVFYFRHSF